jgi:hypothetical protein
LTPLKALEALALIGLAISGISWDLDLAARPNLLPAWSKKKAASFLLPVSHAATTTLQLFKGNNTQSLGRTKRTSAKLISLSH